MAIIARMLLIRLYRQCAPMPVRRPDASRDQIRSNCPAPRLHRRARTPSPTHFLPKEPHSCLSNSNVKRVRVSSRRLSPPSPKSASFGHDNEPVRTTRAVESDHRSVHLLDVAPRVLPDGCASRTRTPGRKVTAEPLRERAYSARRTRRRLRSTLFVDGAHHFGGSTRGSVGCDSVAR